MISDCRTWKTEEDCEKGRLRVFVDDVEIRQVWYLDTESGIVKTYDVLGDDKAHLSREVAILVKGGLQLSGDVELPIDGVASKTIHGNVRTEPL